MSTQRGHDDLPVSAMRRGWTTVTVTGRRVGAATAVTISAAAESGLRRTHFDITNISGG